MSAAPVQLIIAAYPDADEAARRLAEIKDGRRAGMLGIIDAASIAKTSDGELKLTNARHRGRRGLLVGGLVGGIIGVVAGPLALTAAGGGAIGALRGRLRGAPLKSEMQAIGEELPPDSSVLVAAVEHHWVERLHGELQAAGARLLLDELRADMVEQLETGGAVTFSVAGDGEVAAGGRLAAAADGSSRFDGFLASEEGVVLGAAELTGEPLPQGLPGTGEVAPDTSP